MEPGKGARFCCAIIRTKSRAVALLFCRISRKTKHHKTAPAFFGGAVDFFGKVNRKKAVALQQLWGKAVENDTPKEADSPGKKRSPNLSVRASSSGPRTPLREGCSAPGNQPRTTIVAQTFGPVKPCAAKKVGQSRPGRRSPAAAGRQREALTAPLQWVSAAGRRQQPKRPKATTAATAKARTPKPASRSPRAPSGGGRGGGEAGEKLTITDRDTLSGELGRRFFSRRGGAEKTRQPPPLPRGGGWLASAPARDEAVRWRGRSTSTQRHRLRGIEGR